MLAPVQAGIIPAAQPRQQQLQQPAPLSGVLLPARQQQLGQRDVLRAKGANPEGGDQCGSCRQQSTVCHVHCAATYPCC